MRNTFLTGFNESWRGAMIPMKGSDKSANQLQDDEIRQQIKRQEKRKEDLTNIPGENVYDVAIELDEDDNLQ
jgi:hypothetical protein